MLPLIGRTLCTEALKSPGKMGGSYGNDSMENVYTDILKSVTF